MSISSKKNDHYFLKGGLEMGTLVAEKDWSTTSLGDPSSWPQSLQTMVSVLLGSPVGMYIAWGNDYTMIYNDEFAHILGPDKHPQALGSNAKDLFAQSWSSLQSTFSEVHAGNTVTVSAVMLTLNRNCVDEECYFDFAYSPIRKEDGTVGGILVTVVETTEKLKAEEAVKEVNTRFRNTMRQAPVGITMLRGSQYYVEMANDAYLEIVDKTEEEFVGRPIFESIPETEEYARVLLDDIMKTGNPFRGNEIPIPVNRFGKKDVGYFDFLYHPLREDDGTITGVIAIVTEVTEKVEARKPIEERKRLYETITQNTPDLIYVFSLDYRFTYANEALLTMWGRSWEEAIGKNMFEVGYETWHAEMHIREIDEVISTKKAIRGEVKFPHTQLGERVYDYIFTPVIDKDGNVEAIAGTTRDITPLVEARKLIEQSEKRFEAAVKAVQGILWTNNGQGEMEGDQPGWAALTGQTYDEYQGYGWANAVHPDDSAASVVAWNEAVEERKTFIFEHRLKTKDGEWRDFSIRAIPLLDAEGTITQWVGVHTDITESKLAAKERKANEEKLNIVIEASELGTWELDLQTEVVVASTRLREIMGYDTDTEITLADIAARIHPDYLEAGKNGVLEAFDTGVFYFNGMLQWEDKSIHWIETKGKVFYDKENKPVTIIGTTAETTAEMQQQQVLLESEQKFRLLADSMPQHIWTADPQGNLNYFNQSVFDYSGLTMEQINTDGWIQIVHPDDKAKNIEEWIESVSTGKDFLLEHRFRRHDGEYNWQLSRAIPQRDEKGKIQMWVGTSTDIQDQKTFTKELELQVYERTKEIEKSNEELQKMNKELQSFAYISSHDLQEPLRKIQIFASRISKTEEDNLSEGGKDMFKRMQNAAKRMQTLIQDLLAYSRTSPTEYELENVNLGDLIDEVKEDLDEELKEKNAIIETNELNDVVIIPFQFRQLMVNLVSNALKFSKENVTPVVKIESEIALGKQLGNVDLDPDQKYCHIRVSDNGIGFEQQYSERIFEVFQRLHGKHEFIGTGIGLSIVKKIVENHQGIVKATGELDKGATFDIYIPAK